MQNLTEDSNDLLDAGMNKNDIIMLKNNLIRLSFITRRKNMTGDFLPLSYFLFCRIQHILNEYPIPFRRVAHHNVCHRADKLPILDYRASAHECVQVGTTHFYNFLTVPTLFIKKNVLLYRFLRTFRCSSR